MLKAPEAGVREFAVRGAPISRAAWIGRHDGHALFLLRSHASRLSLVDEVIEVEETVTDYDRRGKAFAKPTGNIVQKPTGKKLEQASDALSNVDLILCVTCGIVAIDHAPADAAKGE